MQCGENPPRFEPRSDTPAGGLAAWWRIETWACEGVYLGSHLTVDAVPGKAGQVRADPGRSGRGARSQQWLGDSWPEMAFFSCFFGGFFQNSYYYAETMGGQK